MVAVRAERALQGHQQPAVGQLHHMAGPSAAGQAVRSARVRDRIGADRSRPLPAVPVVLGLVHRVAGLARPVAVHGLLIDAVADGSGGGGEAADAGVHDEGAVADLGEGAVPVAGVLGVVLDHHPGARIPALAAVERPDRARPAGVGVHLAPLLVVAQQQLAVVQLDDAALVAAPIGIDVGVDHFGVHSAHVLVPLWLLVEGRPRAFPGVTRVGRDGVMYTSYMAPEARWPAPRGPSRPPPTRTPNEHASEPATQSGSERARIGCERLAVRRCDSRFCSLRSRAARATASLNAR